MIVVGVIVALVWTGYANQEKVAGARESYRNAYDATKIFIYHVTSYARLGAQHYLDHLKKPDNQISVLTLLAVVIYTWITHESYISTGNVERRQLRAYITVAAGDWIGCTTCGDISAPGVAASITPDSLAHRFYIEPQVQNAGETPAYAVTGCIKIKRLSSVPVIPKALDLSCDTPNMDFYRTSVESKGELRLIPPDKTSSELIDPKDIYAAYKGEAAMIWYGEIRYRDVFNHLWSTPFCTFMAPHGLRHECPRHNIPNNEE